MKLQVKLEPADGEACFSVLSGLNRGVCGYSLDIVEGTIETAYKRDREKGRLRADEGLEVVIK